jgi:alanine racemase
MSLQTHEVLKDPLLVPTPGLHDKASSWVEIDKAAFASNIAQYALVAPQALLAVVVKSNAYGHGLVDIATLCQHNSHVQYLCVVSLSEAILLRKAHITKPIIVLSIIDAPVEEAINNNVAVVVYDMQMAREFFACANRLGRTINVHVKIDTGLSRLGFGVTHAVEAVTALYAMAPHIRIEGIFTHFADSECEDQTFVHYQLTQFHTIVHALQSRGIMIPLQHTSCSAAVTSCAQSHQTMVRIGIGAYGLWPSPDNKKMTLARYPAFTLKPVLTWKTRVVHVQQIEPGGYVGYDRTFQVRRQTVLATVPVGYWDGYDRELSNKGLVLIHEKLAPIVGRVAMNLMMVDVTGLSVTVGDIVTLLGDHAGVLADDIARACNTINYEIVTRINPLLTRVTV